MPNEGSRLKQKARALAASEGINYREALARITASAPATANVSGANLPTHRMKDAPQFVDPVTRSMAQPANADRAFREAMNRTADAARVLDGSAFREAMNRTADAARVLDGSAFREAMNRTADAARVLDGSAFREAMNRTAMTR
jgi:hypothetical protein